MNKIDVKDVVKFHLDTKRIVDNAAFSMLSVTTAALASLTMGFWAVAGTILSIGKDASLLISGSVTLSIIFVALAAWFVVEFKKMLISNKYHKDREAELARWLDEKYSVKISQNIAFSILSSLVNSANNISDEFVVQNSEGDINGYVLGLEKPDLPGEYLLYTNDTFTRVEQNN